jgi:hypothetical protein
LFDFFLEATFFFFFVAITDFRLLLA